VKLGFRLSRPADFKRVRRLGKSYAHPFVVLIAMPNELGKVRVAVAAGKPIGGAVVRNRAKRVLRAGILPLLEWISSGQDIVLIAKAGIREKKSTQVKEVLAGLLQKGKLLKTKE
jgi:ribonuclease P protein component